MAAKKLIRSFSKNFQSISVFGVDRTDWLEGDIILSSVWDIPAPLTDNGNIFTPEGTSTVWIGGGNVGVKYTIENKVITSGGETDVRCIQVVITDC